VRWWLVCLALLGLLLVVPSPAGAASPTGVAPTAGVSVDTSVLDSYMAELGRASAGTLPPIRMTDIVNLVFHRGPALDLTGLLAGLLRYLFREVLAQTGLLGKLLVIGVAVALLEHVGQAFAGSEAARFAQAVAYLALIAVALQSFGEAALYVRTAIHNITGVMEALLPVLTTLLAALGAVSTIAFLRPAMLITANLVGLFVANVVIPAIFLATVVELVGQMTGYRLKGLGALLKQLGVVSMGLGLTLFLGVVSVLGMVVPVGDSIFLRTGKFFAVSFVPVVGKLFSDAAEVVFGSTFLLKDAIGLAGVLLVLLIAVLPVLKILAIVFAYRVAGAVLAPVGADPLSESLGTLANNLLLVAVALGVLVFMFYIAMTLVFAGGRGLV
jgi:stage III sporulation protein AE